MNRLTDLVVGIFAGFAAVSIMGASVTSLPLQVQNAGSPLGASVALNCGTNMTCSLSGGVATIAASGGSAYNTVQSSGAGVTQRTTINFTGAGISCADNSGSTRTDCTVGATIATVPGGSASSVQFNAGGGALGGLTYAQSDGNGYLMLPSAPISPNPPNGVTLFARTRATRSLLTWNTPSGVDQFAQPALWANNQGFTNWTGATSTLAAANTTGIWRTDLGWISSVTTGTPGGPVIASTSMSTAVKRGLLVSNSSTGAMAEWRVTSTPFLWRGNNAGLGGFFCQFRWTIPVHSVGTDKLLVGLTSTTGTHINTTVPSAVTSTLYAGYDAAATAISLCGNDASGSATCFACSSTDYGTNSTTGTYAFSVYSAPSSTTASMELRRLDYNAASCTTTISNVADLPSNSTFLVPKIWFGGAGAGLPVTIAPMLVYCETDN